MCALDMSFSISLLKRFSKFIWDIAIAELTFFYVKNATFIKETTTFHLYNHHKTWCHDSYFCLKSVFTIKKNSWKDLTFLPDTRLIIPSFLTSV